MPPKKRTRLPRWNARKVSNFYPLYAEGRDEVKPVAGIVPSFFQEVVPRYRLSTSDTRDQGTGPMFDEVAYSFPVPRRVPPALSPPEEPWPPAPVARKRKKIRFDFWM